MSSKQVKFQSHRYVVATAFIVLAAVLRIWPLQALESNLAWLTFYPAVMGAAIYGGLHAGLLATVLACLTVLFLSPLLVTQPFINVGADWLGLVVFVLTCVTISCVAEAMRRANERATQAQQAAEAANQAKSAFLASMSHELRTPLNAILGFTNILRHDTAIPADKRSTLDIVNRSGEHLLALIDDVLDMAKIDAGHLEVENSVFDLGEMLREVTDLLRIRCAEKNLQLVLEPAPDLPHFVLCDAAKLRQTLINLLGNAIKFTGQGTVMLRARARPGALAADRMLVLEVHDTGIGIAAADQAQIFEPFVQLGMIPQHKGTGLGLAITRRLVDMLGGSISVQSSPGQGSVFLVEIPIETAQASVVNACSKPSGRRIGLENGQDEWRILVVEDQIENALLLRQILEPIGFQMRVASNGQEGIDLFLSWRPHLIWMDIRMPVMDGMEATRRIRALQGGQEVKIVALTASVFKAERERVMVAGMDDLVCKPYRPEEILDGMQRHLGVRFVHEGLSPASNAPAATAPSLRTLASLPDALRLELRAALLLLDTSRIMAVIARIAGHSPPLGEALAHQAAQFNYTALLHALDAGTDNPTPEQATS